MNESPLDRYNIDWEALSSEAIRHFRRLLQIDTTNPPGNEIAAARYLEGVLEADGIDPQVLESEPGRASLVARLKGGPEGALLLSAHTDVVPAEAEHWQHPPFSGIETDGYIWGRGAIDMKHMLSYSLMATLLARRLHFPLNRDLVFAAVADEEAGCFLGSRWLAATHPELLESAYALNEVGAFTLHVGNQRLYPVQVAEKGFVWLRLTARGQPGHGSIPHDRNAVVSLARAVDLIGSRLLPFHLTAEAATFISAVAEALSFPAGLVLRMALNENFSDFVLTKVLPDRARARVFLAQLHNTVCPTGLEAGKKTNVIPSSAAAILDCRILPGQTTDGFLRELRNLLGDDYDFQVLREGQPTRTTADTPLFRTISDVLRRRDPGCRVTPYLVVGFTDAESYSSLGIKTYGFSPVQLPPDVNFTELFHAHNERIPVAGFRWGLRTFLETVFAFCQ